MAELETITICTSAADRMDDVASSVSAVCIVHDVSTYVLQMYLHTYPERQLQIHAEYI